MIFFLNFFSYGYDMWTNLTTGIPISVNIKRKYPASFGILWSDAWTEFSTVVFFFYYETGAVPRFCGRCYPPELTSSRFITFFQTRFFSTKFVCFFKTTFLSSVTKEILHTRVKTHLLSIYPRETSRLLFNSQSKSIIVRFVFSPASYRLFTVNVSTKNATHSTRRQITLIFSNAKSRSSIGWSFSDVPVPVPVPVVSSITDPRGFNKLTTKLESPEATKPLCMSKHGRPLGQTFADSHRPLWFYHNFSQPSIQNPKSRRGDDITAPTAFQTLVNIAG